MAGYYGLLDCEVDICAGRADGVIAKENVRNISFPSDVLSCEPPAVLEYDCPVDICAGRADGVVAKENLSRLLAVTRQTVQHSPPVTMVAASSTDLQ